MTKRQMIFFYSCMALLILSLAVITIVANVTQAQPAAATLTPRRATLIYYSLTEVGMQIIPISSLPAAQYQQLNSSAIAKNVAIANARPYAALDTNQPSSVDAVLGLFTDFNRGWKDIFAWIVTYKGVIYLPGGAPGGQPETNTEQNVVIDARTGEYLEAFSYR